MTGFTIKDLNSLMHGTRSIDADTAARLAGTTGISEEAWLAMQKKYDDFLKAGK